MTTFVVPIKSPTRTSTTHLPRPAKSRWCFKFCSLLTFCLICLAAGFLLGRQFEQSVLSIPRATKAPTISSTPSSSTSSSSITPSSSTSSSNITPSTSSTTTTPSTNTATPAVSTSTSPGASRGANIQAGTGSMITPSSSSTTPSTTTATPAVPTSTSPGASRDATDRAGPGSTITPSSSTTTPGTTTATPAVSTSTSPGASRGATKLAWPNEVCTDTCSKAKDGKCNDGRAVGAQFDAGDAERVWCDLGTDCVDCGPWKPSGPVDWLTDSVKGPIAQLVEKGIEVHLKRTQMPDMYLFAYDGKDLGSAGMAGAGMIEVEVSQVFHRIFKNGCSLGSRLFVDVGATFGWYSLIAATNKCRVIAFEPVPHFRALLQYNVHVNGFASLVDVQSHLLSHESSTEMEVWVPEKGYLGTAGIKGYNVDGLSEKIKAPSKRLEDIVKEDVLMLMIDVEGWEWAVVEGAMKLLQNHKVDNIFLDYSPGIIHRAQITERNRDQVEMLIKLAKMGYLIGIPKSPALQYTGFSADLPHMEEVTQWNLQYDLKDAELIEAKALNCPIADALRTRASWGDGSCGTIPEDLSPRSLRSMVGHSEYLWLAKSRDLMRLNGTVGALKKGDLGTKYTTSDPYPRGMGGRVCKHLPPEVQVRNRCPCSNATLCGKDDEVAQQIAQQGLIKANYVLEAANLTLDT